MNMDYIAHKNENGSRQLLIDHLLETSNLSAKFAAAFGMSDLGHCIGLYHDIGKYSSGFQNRILFDGPKVDHSSAGAIELKKTFPIGAFCVAGHHSGLMNLGSNKFLVEGTLCSRLNKKLIGNLDYSAFEKENGLMIDTKYLNQQTREFFGQDIFSCMFLTRMLFSCLVDADFLDTECFMSGNNKAREGFDDLEGMYQRYLHYVEKFNQATNALNAKRNEIRADCLKAASEQEGIYTLTVPTGGGKTIASLGFALKHAVLHKKTRIIYVIPYTSIIEQTADVFKGIVGDKNVVEHHMNVDYDKDEQLTDVDKERSKLATENWDAPIIVTTNVQFFESLFANKVSRCRKLHNIANSVIIFDEAQMLPNDFLKPCVRAINELIAKYKVTAVLCTATQPSLDKLFPATVAIKEICQNVKVLYNFFRRVRYQQEEYASIESLAAELNSQQQVLCIVNSKKTAQTLFEQLKGTNCFHLSTFMYPNHRRRELEKIGKILKADTGTALPCKVIATNLVEAGVDLDFPVVYRELAGLDNIIQAAGRCNREGKNTWQNSVVHIFKLAVDGVKLPGFVRLPIEVTESIKTKYEDIASVDAIKDYFDELHNLEGDNLDVKKIIARSDRNFPFKDIARDFVLIDNEGKNIFIPRNEESKILLQKLRNGVRTRELLRAIGQYTVSVYSNQFDKLRGQGTLEIIDDNIAVLIDMEKYDMKKGLIVNMEDGVGVFI